MVLRLQQAAHRSRPALRNLIDLCGVDYLTWGNGTRQLPEETNAKVHRARFAVVAHLLSVKNNWRLRVRTFAPDDEFPMVASLMESGRP